MRNYLATFLHFLIGFIGYVLYVIIGSFYMSLFSFIEFRWGLFCLITVILATLFGLFVARLMIV